MQTACPKHADTKLLITERRVYAGLRQVLRAVMLTAYCPVKGCHFEAEVCYPDYLLTISDP